MDIDDILTKDRIKTREINLLVTENRALEARVAALTAALEKIAAHGTIADVHVQVANAALDAADGR